MLTYPKTPEYTRKNFQKTYEENLSFFNIKISMEILNVEMFNICWWMLIKMFNSDKIEIFYSDKNENEGFFVFAGGFYSMNCFSFLQEGFTLWMAFRFCRRVLLYEWLLILRGVIQLLVYWFSFLYYQKINIIGHEYF